MFHLVLHPAGPVLIRLSLKVATVSRGHPWDRCVLPLTNRAGVQ